METSKNITLDIQSEREINAGRTTRKLGDDGVNHIDYIVDHRNSAS